ncbi:MAG TPA: DNA polymerase III subunit delta' [Candidatus Desulfofervidus auxilii]|uniref:DNA polymerase III subunit delta n=1 Tax=Desulfofervidus auxilii TaxID=1621989 RepID=A0A7C0U4M6_DESA2|nr:DNA polymerase III subunit delta' [Candidatus Desulfofervidus auxilii]
MAFREIIGQKNVINWLKSAFAKDRLASAYLFSGPEGIGKTTVAINFAKFLNCHSPKDGDACEKCSNCVKINANTHPDVIVIQGEVIKIEQIRFLEQTLSLKPFIAKKRVVIIKQAENMTLEAANAFLKTLEEPPLNTILILTTSHKYQLLPTIVSRCQMVIFKPLPLKIIQEILEKKGVDKTKAFFFASLSQGSLGKALRFLEEEIDFNWIYDLVEKISIIKTWKGLNSILEKTKDLENFEKLLDFYQALWRDILLIKYQCEDFLINKELIDNYRKIASTISLSEIKDILIAIEQIKRWLKQNVSKETLLEYLVLKRWY